MAERWDGASWRRVPAVSPAPEFNGFKAVAAIGRADVWAVGDFGSRRWALMEHWNGSSWRRVKLPRAARLADLRDLVAIEANDVWAIGSSHLSGRGRTLHWDGSSWTLIPSVRAPVGQFLSLLAGAATGPNDVWAVGDTSASGLTLHWDGRSWRRFRDPPHTENTAVVAITPNDAWTAGRDNNGSAYVKHWDGTAWTAVSVGPEILAPSGLAAASSANVWGVGPFPQTSRPASEHWDGTSWTRVSSQTPNAEELDSIAYVPGTPGTYWAVGSARAPVPQFSRPLIITRC